MRYISHRGGLGGYTIRTDWHFDRPVMEADTFTCQHCNRVTFCCDPVTFKPMPPESLGGRCTCCDKLICSRCVGQPCYPIEKRLDDEERAARDAFLRMVDGWKPLVPPKGFKDGHRYD